MATSLYDLSVPSFLQTLRALRNVLARAARHCAETGADADDFVVARLIDDMAPLHFQIEALRHHAVWGMEAARTGVFDPPPLRGPMPFADLQALVDAAITELEALAPRGGERLGGPELRNRHPSSDRPRERSPLGLGSANLSSDA